MVQFHSKLDSSKTDAINKSTFKRLWWVLALSSALFILIGVIGILLMEDIGDMAFGIFFIAVGVCLAPLVLLITKITQKKVNKTASFISNDTDEIYTFDTDHFTVMQRKADIFNSNIDAKYSYLFKVIENKTHYFMYISKMQCYVIDKTSLTQGTLEELNTILKNNLGAKFKCCEALGAQVV